MNNIKIATNTENRGVLKLYVLRQKAKYLNPRGGKSFVFEMIFSFSIQFRPVFLPKWPIFAHCNLNFFYIPSFDYSFCKSFVRL